MADGVGRGGTEGKCDSGTRRWNGGKYECVHVCGDVWGRRSRVACGTAMEGGEGAYCDCERNGREGDDGSALEGFRCRGGGNRC